MPCTAPTLASLLNPNVVIQFFLGLSASQKYSPKRLCWSLARVKMEWKNG